MGKYTGGNAHLTALVLSQGGKAAEGAPKKGAYEIAMKPNMTLKGEPAEMIAELKKTFPDCEFTWAK